ncbi:MAG: sigma-54-dependent transcriptional regulator [Myxococcales bacterium]
MAESVLIVDDDVAVAKVLTALLTQGGLAASTVASGEAALAVLEARPVDLVVTDLRMDGMGGMDLLAESRRRYPEIPVVVLTAHGTVALAVEAMKAGAADFLLKPFDREEVLYTVRKALAVAPPSPARAVPPLRADSPKMAEAVELLRRSAAGIATVLIRGESGTGKELAARALHDLGPRRERPFVTVQAAALPETLLEAELFGYERGAFTGAASRKPGRVELAEGGTLFLDEVGDIPASVQVKLLRLLQGREYERLGGVETRRADVRFVAATNRPLEEMVGDGRFREDLFYRLNVIPIFLPPLRERAETIPALAQDLCAALGAANARPEVMLEPGALALLSRQSWPGNVRELSNFLERLVILSSGATLTVADVERELQRAPRLPARGAAAGEGPTLDAQRRAAEREAIQNALRDANQNRTRAAKLLGVSRRTFYNKLDEHGLT